MIFGKQGNNVEQNDIESGYNQQVSEFNNELLKNVKKIEKDNETKHKSLLVKLNEIKSKIGWISLLILVVWFIMSMHFNDISSKLYHKTDNYNQFHCVMNDDNQTMNCSILKQ